MKVVFLIVASVILCCSATVFKTTDKILASHGYPWEKHLVQTSDGYKLNMFRIPHSHRTGNQAVANKSAVLLLHGLLCSSDTWVLNGPNDGLVYMLADSGYDVWIGNARGNDYSQGHTYLSPVSSFFWAFSFHEMGVYDIPAMIDYIISTTDQNAVHYVGHSQGTTAFMTMLSSRPSYNNKIKTSHLMGPAIFMEHVNNTLMSLLSPIMGQPNELATLLGTGQFTPGDDLQHLLLPPICKQEPIQEWCANILWLIAGGPSMYTNLTLMGDYSATHPADSSTRQILHFMQIRQSTKFRQYDFGAISNYAKYGTPQPPEYQLSKIDTQIPIDIYYSDNDALVPIDDVRHLEHIMAGKISSHQVKFPEFNHNDFVLANNVKEVINDCILDQMNEFENKPFMGNLCNNFKN